MHRCARTSAGPAGRTSRRPRTNGPAGRAGDGLYPRPDCAPVPTTCVLRTAHHQPSTPAALRRRARPDAATRPRASARWGPSLGACRRWTIPRPARPRSGPLGRGLLHHHARRYRRARPADRRHRTVRIPRAPPAPASSVARPRRRRPAPYPYPQTGRTADPRAAQPARPPSPASAVPRGPPAAGTCGRAGRSSTVPPPAAGAPDAPVGRPRGGRRQAWGSSGTGGTDMVVTCDEARNCCCGPRRPSVVRRRPTLPPSPPGSTIGAERLSFRVRNGTGRFPLAMTAVTLWRYGRAALPAPGAVKPRRRCWGGPYLGNRTVDAKRCKSSPRPISTGQLHPLRGFHFRPINPMVSSGALPG